MENVDECNKARRPPSPRKSFDRQTNGLTAPVIALTARAVFWLIRLQQKTVNEANQDPRNYGDPDE